MHARSRSRAARFVTEFAVIVVGVLVALTVDSWRDNQIERDLERSYLEQIVTDSHENLRLIREAIALEQRHFEAVEALWRTAQRDGRPSADSVAAWLGRRDKDPDADDGGTSWWSSDPRLRDGTMNALARTGDFALIQDAQVRSGVLGYVSQLEADQEEFRRAIDGHVEARKQLNVRGELGLTPDLSPDAPREVRLYLAILRDPEGRAALTTLRRAYVNRLWYLRQIESATTALLNLMS